MSYPNSSRKRLHESSCPTASPKDSKEKSINTYVFTKCIVTDDNLPKLAEVAMIAINRVDITRNSHRSGSTDFVSPRYKDTLVLNFSQRKPNGAKKPTASQKLRPNEPFDKHAVDAINNFLQKQSQPVCLVAHNGRKVDFKVLKTEIAKLNAAIFGRDGSDFLWLDTVGVFDDMAQPGSGTPPPNKQRQKKEQTGQTKSDHRQSSSDPNPESAKYFATCLLEICIKSHEKLLRLSPQILPRSPDVEDVGPSKRYRDDRMLLQNQETSSSVNIASKKPGFDATETYVLVDLETTGLDIDEADIAELCMFAVNKGQLSSLQSNGPNRIQWNNIIPRVTDECTLMIRPEAEIGVKASDINGLTIDEFMARDIAPFSARSRDIIRSFLERQPKPVCLVAHNGIKFDFPILNRHMKRAQATDGIWREIYLADTIHGLKKLGRRSSCRLGVVYDEIVAPYVSPLRSALHTAEGDVLRMIAIVRLCRGDLLRALDRCKQRFNLL